MIHYVKHHITTGKKISVRIKITMSNAEGSEISTSGFILIAATNSPCKNNPAARVEPHDGQ